MVSGELKVEKFFCCLRLETGGIVLGTAFMVLSGYNFVLCALNLESIIAFHIDESPHESQNQAWFACNL